MGEKYIPTEYRGKNSEKKEEDRDISPAISVALKASATVREEEEVWENFLWLLENQQEMGFDEKQLEDDRAVLTDRLHQAKVVEEEAWTEALKVKETRRFSYSIVDNALVRIPKDKSVISVEVDLDFDNERRAITACFAGLGDFFGDGKSRSWYLAGQVLKVLGNDSDSDVKHTLYDQSTGVKLTFTNFDANGSLDYSDPHSDEFKNTRVNIVLDTECTEIYPTRMLHSICDSGCNDITIR